MPSKFSMEIELDNACFWEEDEFQTCMVQDLLRSVANKLNSWDEQDDYSSSIRDLNGNLVGEFRIQVEWDRK